MSFKMSFMLTMIVGTVGGIAAITAAVFWFWASSVPVPDDNDNFISVLQWVSRLNSYAAFATGVAAICALIVLWFGRQRAYYS